MLRFLTDELQEAEDAGQRVWIVGHVLPGNDNFLSLAFALMALRRMERHQLFPFILGLVLPNRR